MIKKYFIRVNFTGRFKGLVKEDVVFVYPKDELNNPFEAVHKLKSEILESIILRHVELLDDKEIKAKIEGLSNEKR